MAVRGMEFNNSGLVTSRRTLFLGLLFAMVALACLHPHRAAAAETPWVNDTAYGSKGGGFYWDTASQMVWTAERGWHTFSPNPPRAAAPLWVNHLSYGSAGGGFYWDPVSGQVWTAERGWHTFSPGQSNSSPPPAPSGAGLVVSGVTVYTDSINYMHVVGLITNNFSYPVEFVEVTANFYSSSGVLLATDSTYSSTRAIRAGGTSPFEALEASVPGIARTEVVVTDFDSKLYFAVPTGLNPVITNKTVDIIDFGHLVGTVTNNSQTTWNYVEITVALVKDGRVIDVSSGYAKPSTLSPGQTGTFEILISPHNGFDPVNFNGITLLLYTDAD